MHLPGTSTARAHDAHAPLRRLSETALSARAPDELRAALIAEARRALGADAVDVVGAAMSPPAVAHVVATARSLALDEGRLVGELGPQLATALEARSALLVPLGWSGDVRAVAVIARRTPHVWSPDETLIAETLANQASLGLALLDSEQRRLDQAARDRALARAAHALNVSLELQEVLDTLASEAGAAVGGDHAGVYLVDEAGFGVATAGFNCPEEWYGKTLGAGEGIAGQVLATGRAVTSDAYADEMTAPSHATPAGVRSGVGVPMRWNGELRGVLSVAFTEAHAIDREDLGVLEAIADLAVVACHNAEAYEDVRAAASTDALTGLLNHGAMQVRIREEIARAARDGAPLCCVLLDLDDFKRVNDELGHPAGDAFLRRVAEALQAEVRRYDQVARYGGDEFVLVLPSTGQDEARAVAERVRARVRDGLPNGADGPIGGCSIGISAWAAPMSAGDLLEAADRALYLAKRTGKDRVAVASPDAEAELDRLRDSGGSPAAVHALVAAIESRDSYSFDHSELVVRLATGVALLLGLPADAVERVGHGALLHDVGKLAIPPAILHKEGELDDQEWSVMVEHPVLGERILRRIPELAPLAPIVRHEHEHWDGSGYPDGLAGTQIPIGSRIVLACDAYAAMTNSRPYRAALTAEDAVEELRGAAGSQFDPQVVEALLDLLGHAG
ncbi:MAG TPA: diguanylate cyclase [Solirubrobacteraceae bacterium]|nr:diguanylate cyclase [Solirubrobacteraceae bacterium]